MNFSKYLAFSIISLASLASTQAAMLRGSRTLDSDNLILCGVIENTPSISFGTNLHSGVISLIGGQIITNYSLYHSSDVSVDNDDITIDLEKKIGFITKHCTVLDFNQNNNSNDAAETLEQSPMVCDYIFCFDSKNNENKGNEMCLFSKGGSASGEPNQSVIIGGTGDMIDIANEIIEERFVGSINSADEKIYTVFEYEFNGIDEAQLQLN
jgi:hypothetical protein